MINFTKQKILIEFDNKEECDVYYKRYIERGYKATQKYQNANSRKFGFEVEKES